MVLMPKAALDFGDAKANDVNFSTGSVSCVSDFDVGQMSQSKAFELQTKAKVNVFAIHTVAGIEPPEHCRYNLAPSRWLH